VSLTWISMPANTLRHRRRYGSGFTGTRSTIRFQSTCALPHPDGSAAPESNAREAPNRLELLAGTRGAAIHGRLLSGATSATNFLTAGVHHAWLRLGRPRSFGLVGGAALRRQFRHLSPGSRIGQGTACKLMRACGADNSWMRVQGGQMKRLRRCVRQRIQGFTRQPILSQHA
jgi:hypothetical protein